MWYNAESMNEAEKCIQGFKLEAIYERKKSHEGPRCRWEDDNKMDLEKTGYENVN
jgi:hypothetical protein